MSGWALLIGLAIGALFVLVRRKISYQHASGAMLLKWPHGVGRTSVVACSAQTVCLSHPVMRSQFATPSPGAEVLLKPLSGGPVRRGKFVAEGDTGWTVRLA